jgi:hypothetical protein
MRASNGETTLDSFKEVGQQFLESLTLGGAAGNGRNLGPIPAFFSFMHYNFDLHSTLNACALSAALCSFYLSSGASLQIFYSEPAGS